ncbi:hypothetical protein BMS3Bbin12_01532 [bacterium BMS3Bbin12]|nr:hypothetical protein BMS3Abin12_01175 [bacterium BMS3Abin12]GBE48354.1 hypothetical protein BMS3Bbin12_01532 [bacterium BMS3Bbin12]GBE50499.1 hypothetical protein BMS3Bbin13_01439 [bacterium BMS3Bbin13]HDJ86691.1 hypothetical protein [Chromatiales bacterium]
MKGARRYLGLPVLVALLALAGCSTSVERTVYDTLVNLQQQRRPCVAPVPADCPKSPSYDQYRRERDTTRTGGSRASPPARLPTLPR